MSAGEVLLDVGDSIGPGQIALAAAAGLARLTVRRRPTVAVLSSGNELRGPVDFQDVVAGRGVPETNGSTLAAAVAACGAVPLPLGIALDEPEHIRAMVRRSLEADVLVTTGGASMGEADLFKRVLEEDGLDVDFWRVRIRPGSPFSLARLPREAGTRSLPVLGLPGNPASAFVTFQLFVRPFVLRLAGHARVHRRWLDMVAGERLSSTPDLCHFLRVVVDTDAGAPRACLTGHQGSGLVGSLGRAHGLAVLPEGTETVEAGDPVRVVLLDDIPGPSATPGWAPSASFPKA
jgi:molybdopterin molybdotransferase